MDHRRLGKDPDDSTIQDYQRDHENARHYLTILTIRVIVHPADYFFPSSSFTRFATNSGFFWFSK